MEVITRAQAKALGLVHYYLGTPCKHGHSANRYVSSGKCVACRAATEIKQYERNAEYIKQRVRNYNIANRDVISQKRKAAYVKNHSVHLERQRERRVLNPLYNTWDKMLRRCLNEDDPCFPYYGGRGITVCEAWADPDTGYETFCRDMGSKPEGFSLDRIDYNGDYEPSNCRWADPVTQNRNKRGVKVKAEDLPQIFSLIDAGIRKLDIANMFGCGVNNIYRIQKNRKALESGFYDET